ncbi:MAG: GntR family transcriptional regulator [Bacillota bacterium]
MSGEVRVVTGAAPRRMKPPTPVPLHRLAIEALCDFLESSGPPADNRLQPESVLAEQLGVSRATIRETLLAMEREGYITKKHGVGTFVHPSALKARTRIESVVDFGELLARTGCTRVEAVTQTSTAVAGDYAGPLGVAPDHGLVIYKRIFLADGRPAIYTVIRIPRAVLSAESPAPAASESIFSLIRKVSGEEATHRIAWLKARMVDAEVGEALGLPAGEPILSWDSILYNYRDRPLLHSSVFFNTTVVPLCTVGMTASADRSREVEPGD